ncbi:recombinase family protein [Colwellia sp. MB3u-55]|jgi:DNA invertase Pin-like site-specific DNA recombinase|uniref:recombinase family protein n=1 Tax=Colwellia sp. MB3u-55 TaxID=2759810 RepID=UPI00217523E3|nr:recombinase family protein [Colwellia sp. MB3u-55]
MKDIYMTDYIYSRVSTKEQNLEHQTADLLSAYPNAEVVEEKASGKNVTDRPKFKELIETVTAGDKIIVRELSRLGRNTQAILELFDELESKGVAVLIKNLQIDSTSATGKMVLTIMASVATMERDIMLERQAAGITLAKEQGKFKGRKVDPKTVLKCKEAEGYIAKGMSKEKAAKASSVGIATLYRYLNKK